MASSTDEFENIDEYIATFPEPTRKVLQELREMIREVVPNAEETISYKMPTFKQNGAYIVYFGGYKKHVSLYPAPIESPEFSEELAPFASGQGTAKFPLNKPLPVALIQRVVKHNAEANAKRAAGKAKSKK